MPSEKGATHAWCDVCEWVQPAVIEVRRTEDPKGFMGGAITCAHCSYVIATLYEKVADAAPTR